jgi:NADH:ubiquinone oxidoreductase subunit E
LNIENGGITEDNLFSLEEVECMGSCGTAPMFAINEDFFENLSIQKVDEIIESFKNQD